MASGTLGAPTPELQNKAPVELYHPTSTGQIWTIDQMLENHFVKMIDMCWTWV